MSTNHVIIHHKTTSWLPAGFLCSSAHQSSDHPSRAAARRMLHNQPITTTLCMHHLQCRERAWIAPLRNHRTNALLDVSSSAPSRTTLVRPTACGIDSLPRPVSSCVLIHIAQFLAGGGAAMIVFEYIIVPDGEHV